MNKKEIELLAPAKNLEQGKIAINYGADAVYIGATLFSARQAAGNSLQDIEQLALYAHRYNAKVFAAVNTLLKDDEIESANKLCHQLYQLGVDALIIQDFGLLELGMPDIPIHASTQMHNYNIDYIKFLENIGISRAILAREMSLEQIKNVSQSTKLELEAFVFGALCVSFSGRCNFSQVYKGRSGNRGECAQLCRMKYNLMDDKGLYIDKDKYILSLKDMDNSDYIPQLIQSGICSFKIEGRLKDSVYIKNICSYIRKKIDMYLNNNHDYIKSSNGDTEIAFVPDPYKSFNRGLSNYFLLGRNEGLRNELTPKSLGKRLGKISSIEKDRIIIDTNEKIVNGDGLCLFVDGELIGFYVNNVVDNKVKIAEGINFRKGQIIYRNNDLEFEKLLSNDKSIRKIAVDIRIEFIAEGIKIYINDNYNHQYLKSVILEFEKAQNQESAKSNIIKQFNKTGDSIFRINQIIIDNNVELPHIPISELNKIRRELFEDFSDYILSEYKRENGREIKSDTYPEKKLDYSYNVINRYAEQFLKRCNVEQIEYGIEVNTLKKDIKLMTTKMCLKYEYGLCPKYSGKSLNSSEKLYLEDKMNRYSLEFDCKNCEMIIKTDF